MTTEQGPKGPKRAASPGGATAYRYDAPLPTRGPRRGLPPRQPGHSGSIGGALGWSVLGTVLPGAGLLRTRWRPWGIAMLTVLVVGLVALIAAAFVMPAALLGLALNPRVLIVATVALCAMGVIWAASVVVTYLSLRPRGAPVWQQLIGAVVVLALVAGIALPTVVGAQYAFSTASLITGVSANEDPGADPSSGGSFGNAIDPWADKPRLNVLILGGDSGQQRDQTLGARTDTVILASIDTATGKTTLFSLPRQTQRVPFPSGSSLAKVWPNGFTNGVPDNSDYFLNAIYRDVPALAPNAIPKGVQDPGAWALKQGVGEALGLHVDYYAMINMDGFIKFIDALGGITVNINEPVPVGGVSSTHTPPKRWLPVGPNQHLEGFDALWYARGRYGSSDYQRMARQRCVIRAVAAQANPQTVLTNYQKLTEAGKSILKTDVPNGQLSALLILALKVKNEPMSSVSFENAKDGFSTTYPNWDLVHRQVKQALAAQTSSASSAPTPTASKTAKPSTSTSPAAKVDECAYNPVDPNKKSGG